jgi:hypothetical protein
MDHLCVFSLHFLCQMFAFEYSSTLMEIVSLSSYTSDDTCFSVIYAGVDGRKEVLNICQQHPHT